jgi:predicted nucleotide-binding protein
MPEPSSPIKVGGSDFPKFALEDALAAPNALQRNGGQPLTAIDMATALGRSPGSSAFRTVTAASSAYGLTAGSYKTQFSMADGGRVIVEPTSPGEEARGLVAAALHPPLFRKAYDYYKGKKYPEEQFFVNTAIREFGVSQKQAPKFVEIFAANMRFVGLIRDTPGGEWLSRDAVPQATSVTVTEDQVDGLEAETDGAGAMNGSATEDVERIIGKSVTPTPTPRSLKQNRRVFISHGKNKMVVNQLKELLQYGDFEPIVSVEHETTSKPVPDKVMSDMRSCAAGIIHVGTERKVNDDDGHEHHMLNQNVLIEIGAAMALYAGRFILLVEKGTTLPSNLQGLYEVRFEGGGLDHDATLKLLKAFNDFKS